MAEIDPYRAFIVDARRTPMVPARGDKVHVLDGGDLRTRAPGVYQHLGPDYLLATLLRAVVEDSGIDPGDLADVVVGCVAQAGEAGANVARNAMLQAGIPAEVPAQTINRNCASSMEAAIIAAQGIAAGRGTPVRAPGLYLTGGVEKMSSNPLAEVFDPAARLAAYLREQEMAVAASMGLTAEALVESYWLTADEDDAEEMSEELTEVRRAADRFAYHSHRKVVEAAAAGRFDDEIVPVDLLYGQGIQKEDLGPRRYESEEAALEQLGRLPAAFLIDAFRKDKRGTVTAANSSPETDGAAALLIASGHYVTEHDLRPLAQIVSWGTAGVDPRLMGYGPVPATEIALDRARSALGRDDFTLDDIGLIELNEAFAIQALTVIQHGWGLDPDDPRINVNGGAVALGHPLGASGARILTTLVHEMSRRGVEFGLATMCVGVGQGDAVILRNISESGGA